MKSFKQHNANNNTDLAKILNLALANEWITIFQYDNDGMNADNLDVRREFIQHAREESSHVLSLEKIMLNISIAITITPETVFKFSSEKFEKRNNVDNKMLKSNLSAEHRAVKLYANILQDYEFSENNRHLLQLILDKELEHVADLTRLSKEVLS